MIPNYAFHVLKIVRDVMVKIWDALVVLMDMDSSMKTELDQINALNVKIKIVFTVNLILMTVTTAKKVIALNLLPTLHTIIIVFHALMILKSQPSV